MKGEAMNDDDDDASVIVLPEGAVERMLRLADRLGFELEIGEHVPTPDEFRAAMRKKYGLPSVADETDKPAS
jgi:hypothetical protein